MEIYKNVAAIILMGGSGTRAGYDIPKQFLLLSGKPIYLHTFDVIDRSQLFAEIILVVPEEYLNQVSQDMQGKATVISGGSTRQESSYKGCLACSTTIEYVCIHDAVRPFVTRDILVENLRLVKLYGAVDTCIAATDTVVMTKDHQFIADIPTRDLIYLGQTPQTFALPVIKKAHEQAIQDEFLGSDDCKLALRLGYKIAIAKGSYSNIKITHKNDLYFAEQLFRQQKVLPPSCEPFNFYNQTFVITGGTGTIGSNIEQHLLKEHANVISVSLSSKEYPTDLSNPYEVQKTFEAIYNQFGPIDGLINCIGYLNIKPLTDLSPEEIDYSIRSNLLSQIYACKYAKIKDRGHIINFSSSSYFKGRKDYVIYSAAKAAIVNFTQGLAEEYPHLFINVVAPQRILSQMRQINFPNEDITTLLHPEAVAKETLKILKSGYTGLVFDIKKEP